MMIALMVDSAVWEKLIGIWRGDIFTDFAARALSVGGANPFSSGGCRRPHATERSPGRPKGNLCFWT
jgi:hypothetical protein